MANLNDSTITELNSTSYIDIIGLLIGETRLPNEGASQFARRLESIAKARKDHSYEGCLEQISSELGFATAPYITITSTDPNAVISFTFTGLSLISSSENLLIPIANIAGDSMWEWISISDMAANINTSRTFTAEVLIDGWGFHIARQSNIFLVESEPITSQYQTLQHTNYVAGSGFISSSSLTFNVVNNVIQMNKVPGDGVTFSYQYQVLPYDIVGSPVACVGLTDPGFATAAVQTNGAVVYQVREFIQQIMANDLSYWAK